MPKPTSILFGSMILAISFATGASPAEAKRKCKGGGLVGAINCVTEQMDSDRDNRAQKDAKQPKKVKPSAPPSASTTDKNAGITSTSVRNPDGTRTFTKTDRNGNVLSKEVVGKSPASASSTDRKTGVTTTSVRNPDGTHTVTKTDKKGNILSREIVGKSPTSASSTDKKTGITTKSVRNPDGTRTVTKTDKNGNILSRERVH